MRRALILGLVLCAAVPAAAWAHSTVNGSRSEIVYTTEDVISANCLVVEIRGSDYYFKDFEPGRRCVDSGLNASGDCRPGNEVDGQGFYYDTFCPKAGKTLIRIDVGPREDKVTALIDIPIQLLAGDGADNITLGNPADVVLGGPGNDTLDTGAGDDLLKGEDGEDTLRGQAGNDVVEPGLGADTVDSGEGDDDIRSRDGLADRITCGPGVDKVDADTRDEVAADCENVTRTETVAPDGSAGTSDDKRAPKLAVGGLTVQRVARRRTVYVAASSSERGSIAASGRLEVGGVSLPLKSKTYPVRVAGGGVEIAIRLSRSQLRRVLASLRRGRRVYVRMDVVATDRAGNSATRKAPRIRLKR